MSAASAALLVGASDANAADAAPARRNQGYLIGGALTFALPYVASHAVGLTYSIGRNVFCSIDGDVEFRALAGASTASCPNRGYGWLTVPFAGPFISLAGYPQETAPAIALIADGAAQLAGGTLFIVGLLHEEDRAPVRTAAWDLLPGAPGAPAGLALRLRGL